MSVSDNNCWVTTVPMKDDVVDLDAFERIVKEEKEKNGYTVGNDKIFWAMYYTVPTFHNPTGMTISPGNYARSTTYKN